jgi:hypothetical protein
VNSLLSSEAPEIVSFPLYVLGRSPGMSVDPAAPSFDYLVEVNSFSPSTATTLPSLHNATVQWSEENVRSSDTALPEVGPRVVQFSTARGNALARVRQDIKMLAQAARGIQFEDGADNLLSIGLAEQFSRQGQRAIEATGELAMDATLPESIRAEMLRSLGAVSEDRSSQKLGLRYLTGALDDASAFIRDAAVTGLSNLSDPAVIPALEAASEREPVALLRTTIDQITSQLRRLHGSGLVSSQSDKTKVVR